MQIDPDAVATARRRKGLTQGDLAERIGISRNAVGNIETGLVRLPRPYTLRAIADALDVTVDDITTNVKATA